MPASQRDSWDSCDGIHEHLIINLGETILRRIEKMFLIGIEKERVAELAEGTAVRINGFNTTLRREGRYLIYNDEDGVENRCRILMEDEDEIALNFACASHEQDDERHVIVTPDRDCEFENGELVTR
jgi:hypothetical protein